ncbi:MAG: hypothetical protein AAF641_00250 [Pseudomonadota bacterium]
MQLIIPFLIFLGVALYFWHARRKDDSAFLRGLKSSLSYAFGLLSALALLRFINFVQFRLYARRIFAQRQRRG